jgi:hypothetical protein
MNKSQSLFLFACIPTRLLLVFLAFYLKSFNLRLLGLILISISAGFFYLYFTKSRMDAPEAGGKTWWYKVRPIHGSLLLLAGILCILGNKYAYIFLLIDVLLGLSFFTLHYNKTYPNLV